MSLKETQVAFIASLEADQSKSDGFSKWDIVTTSVVGVISAVGLGIAAYDKFQEWKEGRREKGAIPPKELENKKYQTIEILEKTIANQEWVSKQKFRDGELNASEIAHHLTIDGRYSGNPAEAIRQGIKNSEKILSPFQRKLAENDRLVNKAWDTAIKEPTVEAAAAKLEALLKNVPLPGDYVVTESRGLLGSPKVVKDRYGEIEIVHSDQGQVKVKALTAEQTLEIGRTIVEYFKSVKKEKGVVRYDYEGGFPEGEMSDDLWQFVLDEPYADHYSHNYHQSAWYPILDMHSKSIEKAIQAAIRLINLSIGK